MNTTFAGRRSNKALRRQRQKLRLQIIQAKFLGMDATWLELMMDEINAKIAKFRTQKQEEAASRRYKEAKSRRD